MCQMMNFSVVMVVVIILYQSICLKNAYGMQGDKNLTNNINFPLLN